MIGKILGPYQTEEMARFEREAPRRLLALSEDSEVYTT